MNPVLPVGAGRRKVMDKKKTKKRLDSEELEKRAAPWVAPVAKTEGADPAESSSGGGGNDPGGKGPGRIMDRVDGLSRRR